MRHPLIYGQLVALIFLSGTGSALAATMYRWVDAQGVVHYSDTPQPGAERIQMESAQTYKALPAPASGSATASGGANPQSPPRASAYQSCSITQPTAEQSFFAPESVPVVVSLAPSLQPGDELVVTVDGTPISTRGTPAVEFRVPEPSRGSHTIIATVQDADGKAACTAAAVTFNVQRPSLLSPQSPAKGH